ncbi:MAG TPA: N-acetylmuramoyl-L-alanine amidase [Ktedonobacteraceae bacterium]|nr:N-acetylmuramoyl-L-alanine amidase [Ktedonobacteraceae bacterium]
MGQARRRSTVPILLLLSLVLTSMLHPSFSAHTLPAGPISQVFDRAAQEFDVPEVLLKAICYMEGRLSNYGGSPSVDNGFGCMHLVQNNNADILGRAARELKVDQNLLKRELAANIRGGAAILRDYARQLSSGHTLPGKLADWYGAIAAYSNATTLTTALMYADEVYKIINQGFTANAEDNEIISLVPQKVHPNTSTAAKVKPTATNQLPRGCRKDDQVDYPSATDCLLPPSTFDCNQVKKDKPCTYESADRPDDLAINLIVIHDIEGSAPSALNVLQNPQRESSIHYIVDSDGTIYQMLPETAIAYHAGNYWYNQHSIGIEHAGYDAAGFRWYNATEYLASAKLTAYLVKKYAIPLDHAHILSHGTIPSPSATGLPNHVDPGPYWLWNYYLNLIHQQGVALADQPLLQNSITLSPKSSQRPFGTQGRETSANFNFFYLYRDPDTRSARIPQQGSSSDITDVTSSIEPALSYYYLAKARDAGGSGAIMYKIWYGVMDQAHAAKPSRFTHGRLVWLAVPPGAGKEGSGTLLKLNGSKSNTALIYGRPPSTDTDKNDSYKLGDAPNGSHFVSAYSVLDDDGQTLWYEVNYNHRQGWVPESEATVVDLADG